MQVQHTIRSFIYAWRLWFFLISLVPWIVGVLLLDNLGLWPFGKLPTQAGDYVIRAGIYGLLGALILSPLGTLAGLLVANWNRARDQTAENEDE